MGQISLCFLLPESLHVQVESEPVSEIERETGRGERKRGTTFYCVGIYTQTN